MTNQKKGNLIQARIRLPTAYCQLYFSLVGTNTSIAELSGNWNATIAEFYRATTSPGAQVDVVADGGTVTLNIQNTGRFTLTVTEQGEAPETTTGRMAFEEDLLVIFFDDDPEEWEYFSITHNEPNLSISGATAQLNGTSKETVLKNQPT